MCVCVFIYFLKQFNSKTRDGFTVNSKVPSLKDPGKEYDGFTITITGDRQEASLVSSQNRENVSQHRLTRPSLMAFLSPLQSGKHVVLRGDPDHRGADAAVPDGDRVHLQRPHC